MNKPAYQGAYVHNSPIINLIKTLDFKLTEAIKKYDASVERKFRIGHCKGLLQQIYKRYIFLAEKSKASRGCFTTYLSYFLKGFTQSQRTLERQFNRLCSTPFIKKIVGRFTMTDYQYKEKFCTKITIDESLLDFAWKPETQLEFSFQDRTIRKENTNQLQLQLSTNETPAQVDNMLQYFHNYYETHKKGG